MEGFGGITALHVASMKQSSTVMVKLLLAHGANVSHVNSIGQTPLHIAAQHAVHPTVKLLCEAGSDVQAKDNKGRVPIHMA
ncbi:ankyrin repeat-containing domain protein, partial [Baffinella frigidus]